VELGYCCINLTLREGKPSVFGGRSLQSKNFTVEAASAKALANATDIFRIIQWNEEHNIKAFRLPMIFPRKTCPDHGYALRDLPDADAIVNVLRAIGCYAKTHGHFLSMHPNPYAALASDKSRVRCAARKDVVAHALVGHLMKVKRVPVCMHLSSQYGNPEATAERFALSLGKLPEKVRKRIVVENDDKRAGWSVRMLHKHICEPLGVPLAMDIHHWLINHEPDADMRGDYELAKSTWHGVPHEVHWSQSSDPDRLVRKHAMSYRDPVPEFVADDPDAVVLLENKGKEKALVGYRKIFKERAL